MALACKSIVTLEFEQLEREGKRDERECSNY